MAALEKRVTRLESELNLCEGPNELNILLWKVHCMDHPELNLPEMPPEGEYDNRFKHISDLEALESTKKG